MITEVTNKSTDEEMEKFIKHCIGDMLIKRSPDCELRKAEYDHATRQLTIYNMDGAVQRMSIQQIN